MFDENLLNKAVAGAFCNRTATWITPAGTRTIRVIFDSATAELTEDFTAIGDEVITAECESSTVAGMNRKDTLVILSVTYSVLNVQPDGNGWSVITLEKA